MERLLPERPALGEALSLIQEGLFVVDESPALSYMNEYGARLLGYRDMAELVSSPLSMGDFFSNKEEMAGLLGQARGQGSARGVVCRVRRRDGAPLWIEISVDARRDAEGRIVAFWGVFRDLTARREAELARDRLHAELVEAHRRLEESDRRVRESNAALRERNRHLREFSAAVTHDLRSPLTSLKGFAEILKRDHGAALGERGLRLVERIHANAVQMGLIIRGLQELVLLGEEGEPRVAVDLGQVMRLVLENRRAEIESRGALVEVDADLPPAQAQPTKLFMLLDNLVGNALKHHKGPPPPRVWLRARTMDTPCTYTVEDNGQGVSEGDRERIFELFFRGGHDQPGAGVGLAICRRVVQLYGGRIWVERGESGGARFCFQLSPGPAGA